METLTRIEMPPLSGEKMWTILQDKQSNVFRWKDYAECNPRLSKQSNAEHVPSVGRLFHDVVPALKYHNPRLNVELLLGAIHYHEDGEALIGSDELWHNKGQERDLLEYKVFLESIADNDVTIRGRSEEMFLLQFITGPTDLLEAYNMGTANWLRHLRKNFSLEGKVFNALEKADYYMYAKKRGYDECGDVVILVHVLRNHTGPLDEYAKTIPGFREHVWTQAHSESAKEFMERYAGIPGPKDPGGIPAAYEWAYANGYMERPIEIGVVVDKSPAFGIFGDDPRGGA